MDSNTPGTDELNNKIDQYAAKAKQGAGNVTKKGLNKAGELAGKGIKKAAKKVGSTVKKAAAKAAAKVASTTIGQAVTALFATPLGWAIIAIGGVILLILIAGGFYNSNTSSARGEDGEYRDANGNLVTLLEDWDERLVLSYYLAFADKSYYYTIGTDSTLHQGDLNTESQLDKEQREGSFTLSSTLLKYLDETLNKNFVYPSQFIKPVFNTCSTGEEKNGRCMVKELVKSASTDGNKKDKDAGKILATSSIYNQIKGENTYELSFDKKGEAEKTTGISDWGLAPIIHYAENEDETFVRNLQPLSLKYWDEEKREYVTCLAANCPEDLINEVRAADSDIGKDKILSVKKKTYLIDQVATFLGTVQSDITIIEQDTGEDYIREGVLPDKNPKIKQVPSFSEKSYNRAPSKANEESLEILRNKDYKKTITIFTKKQVWRHLTDDEVNSGKVKDIIKNADDRTADITLSKGENSSQVLTPFWKLYEEDHKITWTDKLLSWIIDYQKYYGLIETTISKDSENFLTFSTCKDMDVVQKKKNESGEEETGTGESYFVCRDNGIEQYIQIGEKDYNIRLDNNKTWSWNDAIGSVLASSMGVADTGEIKEREKLEYYIVITYEESHPTYYTLSGDKWKKESDYTDDSIKIADMNNGQYLKDYINYYEVYVPENEYIQDLKEPIQDMKQLIEENNNQDYNEEELQKAEKYKGVVVGLYGEKILSGIDTFWETFCSTDEGQTSVKCNTDSENTEEAIKEGYGIQRVPDSKTIIDTTIAKFKDEETHQNALENGFKNASDWFGIDVNLLKAIAMQESSMNPDANVSERNGSRGAGLMQIKWNDHHGQHSMKDRYENVRTVDVNWDTIADPETNIIYAAMYLRQLILHYNGNVLMAVQAYNQGQGAIDAAITEYASLINPFVDVNTAKQAVINNPSDLGWSNYTYLSKHKGDPTYLTNVLRYFNSSSGLIECWVGQNYEKKVSIDIDKLVFQSDANEQSIAEQINWYANKKIVEANFETLYNSSSSSLTPDYNHEIEKNSSTKLKYIKGEDSYMNSQNNINTIIAQFFANEDNGTLTDYAEITEDMWLEKFNQMFTSLQSKNLTVESKSYADYFAEYPNSPLDGNYGIIRPYGFSEKVLTSQNLYTRKRYTNIVMASKIGEPVRPVASGVVESVKSNSVTIRHKAMNDDEGAHRVYTTYSDIEVSKDIKKGMSVTADTIIGKLTDNLSDDTNISNFLANNSEMSYLTLELIRDEVTEDPTWVIRAAKALDDEGNFDINGDALGTTNEATKSIQKYISDNLDSLENLFSNSTTTNTTTFGSETVDLRDTFEEGKSVKILSISWTRHAGDSRKHSGIDAATYGSKSRWSTHITTFAKGILVGFNDGYTDKGYIGNTKEGFGFGNYVIMLYRADDGDWYQVLYGHMQQNKQLHLASYANNPVLEKGTVLGMVGSSGQSTGPHAHIQVMNLGNKPLSEIMEYINKHRGTYNAIQWGKSYKTPGNRCENGASTPCWVRAQVFFNVEDRTVYTGRIPVVGKLGGTSAGS